MSARPPARPPGGAEPAPPPDLREALAAAPQARAAWESLTPIGRRDFIGWINAAKQGATREKRIRICCEKLASGKRRPCCYAVVPMDLYRALGEDPGAKAQWSALTGDEKRDFSDWIEAAEEKGERKERVARACAALAAGGRRP